MATRAIVAKKGWGGGFGGVVTVVTYASFIVYTVTVGLSPMVYDVIAIPLTAQRSIPIAAQRLPYRPLKRVCGFGRPDVAMRCP
jgi:hypothetical protein